MPEPLFTYDYHEQFLDSVSKYSMLLNLFKCSLVYAQYVFSPWIFIWNPSWNILFGMSELWLEAIFKLVCVEGNFQLVCLTTFAVVDLGEGAGLPLFLGKLAGKAKRTTPTPLSSKSGFTTVFGKLIWRKDCKLCVIMQFIIIRGQTD